MPLKVWLHGIKPDLAATVPHKHDLNSCMLANASVRFSVTRSLPVSLFPVSHYCRSVLAFPLYNTCTADNLSNEQCGDHVHIYMCSQRAIKTQL